MSIADVKATIATNHEETRSCVEQLQGALGTVREMTDRLASITDDSRNPKVDECLAGFSETIDVIEQAMRVVRSAQDRADDYCAQI